MVCACVLLCACVYIVHNNYVMGAIRYNNYFTWKLLNIIITSLYQTSGAVKCVIGRVSVIQLGPT